MALPTKTYFDQSVSLVDSELLTESSITVEAEKIYAQIPSYIKASQPLDNIVRAIASAVAMYNYHKGQASKAVYANVGSGVELDGMAQDMGLQREEYDNDISLAIRVQNAIETHLARGSKSGLESEGGDVTGVTPYVQQIQFAVGIDPIGTGFAIGGLGSQWIQVWNDTIVTDLDMKEYIGSILPIHVKIGLDLISAYGATSGFVAAGGESFIDGSYTITNDGFSYDRGSLIPDRYHQDLTYTLGNLDLGADYANFTWLADWIDHARWDVDYEFEMQLRFSSDEITWGSWVTYSKNMFIAGSDLERYIQCKIIVKVNESDSLSHYTFSRFMVKGLTSDQSLYGRDTVIVETLNEIGN